MVKMGEDAVNKKEDMDEEKVKKIIDECLKMNYKVYDRLAEI